MSAPRFRKLRVRSGFAIASSRSFCVCFVGTVSAGSLVFPPAALGRPMRFSGAGRVGRSVATLGRGEGCSRRLGPTASCVSGRAVSLDRARS
jgi:hypothetical protein